MSSYLEHVEKGTPHLLYGPFSVIMKGMCTSVYSMCVLIDAFQGRSVIETPPHHKAVVCVMESQGHFMHHTCPPSSLR